MANTYADLRMPDNIPDDMAEPREFSPAEILVIAYEARSLPGTQQQRLEEMRAKHREFWFRYPSLLEMCCNPDMDMEQLNYMLNMLSAVKKQSKNLDEADKEVYQHLAGKYGPQAGGDAPAR